MHIMVLGAGVVGITTAWFLQKEGYQVTVVDRQNRAGLETSYANGGQISVSHAEPWANPSAPLKVMMLALVRMRLVLERLQCSLSRSQSSLISISHSEVATSIVLCISGAHVKMILR